MAYDLFLADLNGTQANDRGSVTSPVHSTACSCIPNEDELWHVGSIENGEFEIEMPSGSATVQDSHVAFRLQGFDPETARLIFKIANEASLDIINEGEKPHVVLTDSSRMEAVQIATGETPVVCKNPEDFVAILSANFPENSDDQSASIRRRNLLHSFWTRNHETRSIGSGDPEPNVPGLATRRDETPLYLEAKKGESPLLMGRRFSRYLKARIKAGLPMPDGGGVRGSGWQIRLPDGAVFTCNLISGYHYSAAGMDRGSQERRFELWKQVISDFAENTDRRTGIIELQVFVLSNGLRIPMDLCESRRARDEDG